MAARHRRHSAGADAVVVAVAVAVAEVALSPAASVELPRRESVSYPWFCISLEGSKRQIRFRDRLRFLILVAGWLEADDRVCISFVVTGPAVAFCQSRKNNPQSRRPFCLEDSATEHEYADSILHFVPSWCLSCLHF